MDYSKKLRKWRRDRILMTAIGLFLLTGAISGVTVPAAGLVAETRLHFGILGLIALVLGIAAAFRNPPEETPGLLSLLRHLWAAIRRTRRNKYPNPHQDGETPGGSSGPSGRSAKEEGP